MAFRGDAEYGLHDAGLRVLAELVRLSSPEEKGGISERFQLSSKLGLRIADCAPRRWV